MDKKHVVLIAAIAGVLAIGTAFAVTWDIPPPTQPVEKVVPNERLSR